MVHDVDCEREEIFMKANNEEKLHEIGYSLHTEAFTIKSIIPYIEVFVMKYNILHIVTLSLTVEIDGLPRITFTEYEELVSFDL